MDPCCERDCRVCVIGSLFSLESSWKLSGHLTGLHVKNKKGESEGEREREKEM